MSFGRKSTLQRAGFEPTDHYTGRHRFVYVDGAYAAEPLLTPDILSEPVIPAEIIDTLPEAPAVTAAGLAALPSPPHEEYIDPAEAVTQRLTVPVIAGPSVLIFREPKRRHSREALILDVRPTTHSYPHPHAGDITGEFFLAGSAL